MGTVSFVNDRFGNANKAIYLNGGYFNVNAASQSIWFNGEVTISLWAYVMSSTTGCPRYIHCGTSGASTNFIEVYTCNQGWNANTGVDFGWGITDGTVYIFSSLTTIYGSWQHRAAVSQNSGSYYTTTIYTNLVAYGSATQSAPYLASNNLATCYIGLSWFGEHSYAYIDDMVFYRRALSMAELTALKNYNF